MSRSRPVAPKEVTMFTRTPAPTRRERPTTDAPAPVGVARPLFPPKDADVETRRRWLAHSPWPEVVFASAI